MRVRTFHSAVKRRESETFAKNGNFWNVLDAGSRKMELVAPEEIAESLIQEIESAFSIVPDEAIQCAARRLGFSRVSEQNRRLIDGVLTNLIDTGWIHIVDAKLALKERMAISDS